MNNFLQKNYVALCKGGVIALVLAIILTRAGLIIVRPSDVSPLIYIIANGLSFILCWLLLSFLIHKFPVYKVLGVIGLLVVAIVADGYLEVSFNPITIPLIILFWLGVAYLILPDFFKKYQLTILTVYGLVIAYYFFFFSMTPDHVENHRVDFANVMLFPIPVFVALWGYEQWRWLQTLKADKAKAELALLKSQINPHFLFNTLNNLYGLVVEKSVQAPAVVLKLSDMLRYTIYEGKEELVSLSDEISYLQTYIELHKIRYQKDVDIQFAHKVEEGIQLAPLLFIILLENAFKHGVEPLIGNAYIHLALTTQGNQLIFTIENNYEPTSSKQKAGIGLDNLKQRLAHTYPNQHELKIGKTDSVYSVHLTLDLPV